MKAKWIAIWLGIELFLISILSKFEFNFDLLSPYIKIIITFFVVLPICLLLYCFSKSNKINNTLKVVLWVIAIFLLICFVLASISEI